MDSSLEIVNAAREGDLDEIKRILDKQANRQMACSIKGDRGNTILHVASANGHIHILSHFLDNPSKVSSEDECSVDIPNESGSTPLHWACMNGQTECVKMLLDAGASPTLKSGSGQSAITIAMNHDHSEITDLLLQSFDPDEEIDDEDELANATSSLTCNDEDGDDIDR